MKFDRWHQFKYFEIFAPRYRDKTVLLAVHKVGQDNKIVFTQAASLGTDPYYVSGAIVKKCKKESNGKIQCYVVPLEQLVPLEFNEKSEQDYK
jgi:hypothetical protein